MPSPWEWLLAPVTLGGSLAFGASRESNESNEERRRREARESFEKSLPKNPQFQSFISNANSAGGTGARTQGPSRTGSPGLSQEVTLGANLPQGPSEWANYMLQKQGLEQTGLVDTAQANAATESLGAWNQLAMRGGASGGERERLARSAARGLNESRQRIAREGALGRLGILGDDETRKLDIQKFNIGSLISERDKAAEMAQRAADREAQIKAAAYAADIQGK